jgi:hypothetical protein
VTRRSPHAAGYRFRRFATAFSALALAMGLRVATLNAQQSSCNNKVVGSLTIQTEKMKATFECFWFESSGGHGSLGGGYALDRTRGASVTVLFRAQPGTFACNTKAVLIDYVEDTTRRTAYHYRGWTFGECTLRNEIADGHHWRGHLTAQLVIVEGDTAVGSPRHLHTRKDQSGRPLTMDIDLYGDLRKPDIVRERKQ